MHQNLRIADERLIKLTEAAIKKVIKLLDKESKKYLRISITGGGCSGLSYDLKLVDCLNSMDLVVDIPPFQTVICSKSALYLKGTILDYSTKMIGGGFKFLNPNAKTSCSCGDSFSL